MLGMLSKNKEGFVGVFLVFNYTRVMKGLGLSSILILLSAYLRLQETIMISALYPLPLNLLPTSLVF